MNLKEKYRMEVRQELKKLETMCVDMASLLRGLGIQVGDSSNPLSHEVCIFFYFLFFNFILIRWGFTCFDV